MLAAARTAQVGVHTGMEFTWGQGYLGRPEGQGGRHYGQVVRGMFTRGLSPLVRILTSQLALETNEEGLSRCAVCVTLRVVRTIRRSWAR